MVNCEKDDTIETPIEQQTLDNSLAFSRLLQVAKAKKKEYNRIKPVVNGEYRNIDATFEAKYGEPQFDKSINLTKEDGRPILVTPLKDENNQISKLLLGYLEDNQEKYTVVDQSAKTGTVLYINTVNPEPVMCAKTNIGTKQLGGLFEIARRSDSDCNHEYNFWNTFNNLPPGCYNVSGNNCEGYVFNICEIEEVDESFTQPSDPYDAGNGGGSNNPEIPDNNPGGGTGNPANNTDEPNDPEEEEEENDICGVDPFAICANYDDAVMDNLASTLGLSNEEKECLKSSENCDAVSGLVSYVQDNPDNNAFSKTAALAICGENIIDFELEMIIEINETIAFQEQTCLKSIKDEVVKTKQISKIIKKFEPTNPVLHLEWGMFQNTNWGNTGQAFLNQPEQNTAFININSESLTHVSNIVIVKTIAHEIIHAELYRKLKELVEDTEMISLAEYNALQNNFMGIADYTFRFGELTVLMSSSGTTVTVWGLDPDLSLAHHNQMAAFYRQTLINVMKAFDLSNGTTRPNPEEFYEALSWAGLRKTSDENGNNSQFTDAWKNFKDQIDLDEANIPESERTYNKYIQIIDQEYNSNGINCN